MLCCGTKGKPMIMNFWVCSLCGGIYFDGHLATQDDLDRIDPSIRHTILQMSRRFKREKTFRDLSKFIDDDLASFIPGDTHASACR